MKTGEGQCGLVDLHVLKKIVLLNDTVSMNIKNSVKLHVLQQDAAS